MLKHITGGLAILSLCAACSGASTTATSDSPMPITRIDDTALCATLAAEQRAELEAWNAKAAAQPNEDEAAPIDDDMLPDGLLDCVVAADGVWGLAVTEPERYAYATAEEWHGRGKLIHFDRAGKRAEWSELLRFESECYDESLTLSVERVDDHDRAVLTFETSCPDGDGWSQGHLLEVDGDVIRAPEGLPEVGWSAPDVDGDGLHDLVVKEPFSGTVYVCEGLTGDAEIFSTRLLHAQADGGFSSDDEAARAAVQKQCPAPPADLFAAEPNDGWPVVSVAQNMVCARYYGTRVAELKQAFDEVCAGVELDSDPDVEPECVNELCANAERILKLVETEPPFTLP